MALAEDDLARFHRDPTAALRGADPASMFLAGACLSYGDDLRQRRVEAAERAASLPESVRHDPYVAAALGDTVALAVALREDPVIAATDGGPWRLPPLHYLTYSRVPQQDPLGSAERLLDAGADPSAGFLWRGLPTPFTVLTGCFGHGEGGPGRQPAHSLGEQLARLLLERGAEANDAQTLYNRMFSRDDSHLRLLLEFGLGHGDGGVWQRRVGADLETPEEMVRRQVDWAREHGFTTRLELLRRHGFTEGTNGRSPWRRRRPAVPQDQLGTPAAVASAVGAGVDLNALVDGKTLLHQAAWIGDVEMVRALLAAGADPNRLDTEHGTTPLGWAEWACADDTAELLRPLTQPDPRR